MNIKVGTDILNKERFLQSYKHGGQRFLEKIFTPEELRNNSTEQLASIFCLKEALVKAFHLSHSSWLEITTTRHVSGKVECSFLSGKIAKNVVSLDTSISHEDNLIIAVAVAIVDNT